MSSSPLEKSLQIDFHHRIESLHTLWNTQLESSSQTHPSAERILHNIPILFRFLRRSLQSQQKLVDEYNELTDTSQKVIAICTQYIHDRHDHENELLFLKDKISQTLGQIGYVQHCLKQYWTMIRSLEGEIERLQLLLSNAELLHSHREKFKTIQDTQKIELSRLLRENEHIKTLINQRKELIERVQAQIELDIKELRAVQAVLQGNKLEQEEVQKRWLHIENQTSSLQSIGQQTRTMENEYLDRAKTTKIQYNLVHKQLNSVINQHDQSNQWLSDIQNKEASIKEEIEHVKKAIATEQADLFIDRDQIQELRRQTTKNVLDDRHFHHVLTADKHTNTLLERKGLLMKYHQTKLQERLTNLSGQLVSTVQRNEQHERLIQANHIRLKHQQRQMAKIQAVLKKIIHVNNNLAKVLQENRFLRSTEHEKLRSIKQVSFQKRKQLIIHTKRLHALTMNKQCVASVTLRNSLEITRLCKLSDGNTHIETYCQRHVRQKKTELMHHEKRRASLSRYLHDHTNRIHFLMKKNQLVENELQSKVDQCQSLEHQHRTQQHDRIILSNQKQLCIYSCQQKTQHLDELHKQYDHLEKLSDNELRQIAQRVQANERLKLDIDKKKQQIVQMMSRNQRQIDECSLLHEKIRLYTQLNDTISEQQQRCARRINRFCQRVGDLQRENNRLSSYLQSSRKNFLATIACHHTKLLKERSLDQASQMLSQQSLLVQNGSSKRVDAEKTLEDYFASIHQLMKMIYQTVHWREKLAGINRLYFETIQQIHQQIRRLAGSNEMMLRARENAALKHCKAARAEYYLRAVSSAFDDESTLF